MPASAIYPSSKHFYACVVSSLVKVLATKNSFSILAYSYSKYQFYIYSPYKLFFQEDFLLSFINLTYTGVLFIQKNLFNLFGFRAFWKFEMLPSALIVYLSLVIALWRRVGILFHLSVTEILRMNMKFKNVMEIYLPIY